MRNWIRSAVTGMTLERPAQKMTLEEHAAQLQASGAAILERLAHADPTEANRAALRHLIGIERWGQRRLRVALGEPPAADEYDSYRPPANLDWEALLEEFRAARQDTVNLAYALTQVSIDTSFTIPHNQYGKLTPYAWLRYLDLHASLESKKIVP